MEVVAAGAEHFVANGVRTWADFEKGVAAIFVVFDRKALENRAAGGAGGGGESVSHIFIPRDYRRVLFFPPDPPAAVGRLVYVWKSM